MIEFEKQFPKEIFSTKADQEIVDYWREKQKGGWIAALEWIKTELTMVESCKMINSGYIIRNLIEEELKGNKL